MRFGNLLQIFAILLVICQGTAAQGDDNLRCLQDLTIAVDGGAEQLFACAQDGLEDRYRFRTSSLATPMAYIITDQSNTILEVSITPYLDFEPLGPGKYRVWAASFLGDLLARPGDQIDDPSLGSVCYEPSNNFIPVSSVDPVGGTVSTSTGADAVFTCPGDDMADLLGFNTTSLDPLYAYLITDTNNNIIDIAERDSYDFNNRPPGTCRVWGVSYATELIAEAGDNIFSSQLANGCSSLSSNFITVTKVLPDGGGVALANGATAATVCVNDEGEDQLSFTHQTVSEAPYGYLITDADNNIIDIPEGDTFDFNDAPAGVCRIWGFSFTGNVTAAIGDNAAQTALTDDCFELSQNFITVSRKDPVAGTVSLADGATSRTLCVNDGLPDRMTFATDAAGNENYTFVITDTDNQVIALTGDENTFDFEGAAPGDCRVWGLAYSGNLTLSSGESLSDAAFSDECAELSENFVTIERVSVEGGNILLGDGETEATACLDDGNPDLFNVVREGARGSYAFLVTDTNNDILFVSPTAIINLTIANPGVCRIWGVAYSGELTAGAGDNAAESALSDECFDLSDNFITITRKDPEGGGVSLADGSLSRRLCVNDGMPDVENFTTTATGNENYTFVLTDADNNILDFSPDGSFDFEGGPGGVCRVWGLAYTGALRGEPGDNAAQATLSDECFELSENFVTIERVFVAGGALNLFSGATDTVICLGDDATDQVTFTRTGSTGDYAYLLTDDQNTILQISDDPAFDLTDAEPGICRIWGVAYSGNLTAQAGADAAASSLSDECFQLSDNFITLTRKLVDGGAVTLDSGSPDTTVCSGDDTPSRLFFTAQTAAENSPYTFILTDTTDNILLIINGNSLNFDFIPAGVCRIYGLSYTGNLSGVVNRPIDEAMLSDECFERSENFVTIRKEAVDGGRVALASGATERITCPGDGIADIITYESTGSSTGSYVYLITDTNNVIQEITEAIQFDFEALGVGESRIWGLAYTGTLRASPGDDAAAVALTDECFDLSENFIRIERRTPQAGTISTASGQDSIFSCPGSQVADLVVLDSNDVSNNNYTYLLTDRENRIQFALDGDRIDFDSVPQGSYRIWGLAFTGQLSFLPGDDASAGGLSTDCFSLSDNFISISHQAPVGGAVALTSGATMRFVCPDDGDANVLSFSREGHSDSRYTFLITDTNNVIIERMTTDSFEFETLGAGRYRVWGLAYTGALQLNPGDNAAEAALSDDCFDLSANFVSVAAQQPEAGIIASPQGDDLGFCVGDGNPDLVQVTLEGASFAGIRYLLTDTLGAILDIRETPEFDFEQQPEGRLRIYGLAFTGDLLAAPGDNLFSDSLANDCFDFTDNFIGVDGTGVDGGLITTEQDADSIYVCPRDGDPDLIAFSTTSQASAGDYRFVVATPEGLILRFLSDGEQNFENTGFRVLEVRGLSFTGNLLVGPGDNLNNGPVADGCFAFSENRITVFQEQPEGGTISLEDGLTELDFCEGIDSLVQSLSTTSNSVAAYRYLLTDTDDRLVEVLPGSRLDFSSIPNGVYRLWGLSFTGGLSVSPGDALTTAELAGSCFELSDNFISISRNGPVDGGVLSLRDGSDQLIGCPNNGRGDIAVINTTSQVSAQDYRYVMTDTTDRIVIPQLGGPVIDFDGAPAGVYRVYAVSYTGTFDGQFGRDITTTVLSDSCFELSDNFLSIVLQTPEGGRVSTVSGQDSISVITGDGISDRIAFTRDSAAQAYYRYVLTGANDTVIAVDTAAFELDSLSPGDYRVWGLSFTGELSLQAGDTLTAVNPSDDCFDLSDNFVQITALDGGVAREAPASRIHRTDIARQFAIKLAPNPAQNWINVRVELDASATERKGWLRIFSTSGVLQLQEVIRIQAGKNQYRINVGNLRAGMYLIQVSDGRKIGDARFIKPE